MYRGNVCVAPDVKLVTTKSSIDRLKASSAAATTPDAVYAALQKATPAKLMVLPQSEAQDSDAIVVTQDTASKYNLKTIADLAKPSS